MAWRDNLRQASFRSAFFYVDSSDYGFGRRNVLHQYPFKDEPYVEDLGPDADEFTINAYVIQDINNDFDYFTERDNLISVLKESGSGLLVHPFLGEITVALQGKARMVESFAEGGIARFTMTFVQAGINKFPQTPQDVKGAVDEAAQNGLNTFADTFNSLYSIADSPGFVVDQAISDMGSAFNMIKSSILSIKNTVISTVSKGLAIVDGAKDLLSDVVSSPCEFASNVVDAYDSYLNIVGLAGDTFTQFTNGICSGELTQRYKSIESIDNSLGISTIKAMIATTRFGELPSAENMSQYGGIVPELPLNNFVRARESANRIAYTNLTRATSICQASRVATRIEYSSFDEAISTMELVTEAVDELLLKMGNEVSNDTYIKYGITISNEQAYDVIESLKPVFIKSMRQIGASLAKVVNYKVQPGVQNTIALSYKLYEDADRNQEIFDRNRPDVNHPGFLPQTGIIEVLNE